MRCRFIATDGRLHDGIVLVLQYPGQESIQSKGQGVNNVLETPKEKVKGCGIR